MPAIKRVATIRDFKTLRSKVGMSQTKYWERFGVTQSGASRYESGRGLPLPVEMLMVLREAGALSDFQLETARQEVLKAKAKATKRTIASKATSTLDKA